MFEFGFAEGLEKLEEVALLFLAGGDGGPQAFVVTLADFASGALSDEAVDHALADLLFVVVVGGFQSLGEHEPEVVLRQVVRLEFSAVGRGVFHDGEARSEIPGLVRGRRLANQV